MHIFIVNRQFNQSQRWWWFDNRRHTSGAIVRDLSL